MIQRSLFRKNYVIFVSIVLFFIFLAIASSWIFTSYERDRMFQRPATMHRLLLKYMDEDPLKALPKLNAFAQENNMPPHELIHRDGVSVLSGAQVLPEALTEEQLSQLEKDLSLQIQRPFAAGPPVAISKTSQDGVYLYSLMAPPGGKPPVGPLITLAAIVSCILVSLAVALLYQSSKYQKRSQEAVEVLQKMREGNLAARMPQQKQDELSALVDAFNQMAGDLEKMVDQLRKSDQARRQLLQDLAHDLRTPLTSLRTFLETLHGADERLKAEQRKEILDLSFSEVEYFGKLVEDLLFLAQITEPQYSIGTEVIDLRERLEDQVMVFRRRAPHLQISLETDGADFQVRGSEQLIDRLLRNAFENSASFARHSLLIRLTENDLHLEVAIQDDGPGFSAKALAEFGHKKASRVVIQAEEGQRISVGIGSVIMREISQLHGGDLKAENLTKDGRTLGACVSFSLKKS